MGPALLAPGLLERMALSDDMEKALTARNFEPRTIPSITAAAWDLHRHLAALQVG